MLTDKVCTIAETGVPEIIQEWLVEWTTGSLTFWVI